MEFFVDVFRETLMITSFVMVMMLIIEYINVVTQGQWRKPLQRKGWLQVVLASFLGIIPGCLGTYTVVSMYTHNLLGFGALVAAMIATSGDEAFIMFSAMPREAFFITGGMLVLAIGVGLIIHMLSKSKRIGNFSNYKLEVHEDDHCCGQKVNGNILNNLRSLSFSRAILIFGIILFVVGLVTGQFTHEHKQLTGIDMGIAVMESDHGHDHNEDSGAHAHEHEHDHGTTAEAEESAHKHGTWNWITITFLVTSLMALIVILIVPDHFLQEHLWGHIIKRHFLKILLWTFGALLAVGLLMQYVDFQQWIRDNSLTILFAAILIGIIPQSGPHIMFIGLYLTGSIPVSILVANSIVQDGHGSLPLFAESKRSFLWVKAVNVLVGLLVGLTGYFFGW